MQPETGGYWQKWLLKHGERIRLLCALQEEAIRHDRWDELQQLLQEQEELLGEIWQAVPPELPPDVLTFVQEIRDQNLRLQQRIQSRMETLRAEMAGVSRSRNTLRHYHTELPAGHLEDRAA